MPPSMDDGMWGDDDPVYLPEQRGGLRRRPGGFDPFLNGSPQGYPPQDSVTRGPGLAQDMISRMRMKQQVEPAGRAVQYRSAPPRSAYPPQSQGYAPQSYAPQQQSYAPQPQSYGLQQSTGGQQPVMYYDPKTGAIANPPQVTPQTAPQYMAYPPGMMGFPQAQGQNPFMFPGMPNMSYMMPQAPQQQQPIVIPGQLYTRDGGMHQLG